MYAFNTNHFLPAEGRYINPPVMRFTNTKYMSIIMKVKFVDLKRKGIRKHHFLFHFCNEVEKFPDENSRDGYHQPEVIQHKPDNVIKLIFFHLIFLFTSRGLPKQIEAQKGCTSSSPN